MANNVTTPLVLAMTNETTETLGEHAVGIIANLTTTRAPPPALSNDTATVTVGSGELEVEVTNTSHTPPAYINGTTSTLPEGEIEETVANFTATQLSPAMANHTTNMTAEIDETDVEVRRSHLTSPLPLVVTNDTAPNDTALNDEEVIEMSDNKTTGSLTSAIVSDSANAELQVDPNPLPISPIPIPSIPADQVPLILDNVQQQSPILISSPPRKTSSHTTTHYHIMHKRKQITRSNNLFATQCSGIGGVLIQGNQQPAESRAGFIFKHLMKKSQSTNNLTCQVEVADEIEAASLMQSLKRRLVPPPSFQIVIRYRSVSTPVIQVGDGHVTNINNHPGTTTTTTGIESGGRLNDITPEGPPLVQQSSAQLADVAMRLQSLLEATARQVSDMTATLASMERQLDHMKRRKV